MLGRLLGGIGAHVSVSARRPEDIAAATVNGLSPVRFGSDEFRRAAVDADVIFNTVPAKIIDKTLIDGLEHCRLIIDLASGKGGVDFTAASARGIKAIHALSLPGKVAPFTAGQIICDCVLELLIREGVIARP